MQRLHLKSISHCTDSHCLLGKLKNKSSKELSEIKGLFFPLSSGTADKITICYLKYFLLF